MSYVPKFLNETRARPHDEHRVATFLLVLGAHIGLIILLVLSRQAEPQTRQRGSLSMFALAAAAPLASPVPVIVPILPADDKSTRPKPAELFAMQQGAKGDPDGVECSPIDVVTTKLINDPLVPVAITQVPSENRSISEAIVMWNAEWSTAAIDDDGPLRDVRELIHQSLTDLPPDCLAEPVIGPRLIPITDEHGSTTFLAFGSGEWSWQQLLQSQDADMTNSTGEKAWTWDQILEGDIPPIF